MPRKTPDEKPAAVEEKVVPTVKPAEPVEKTYVVNANGLEVGGILRGGVKGADLSRQAVDAMQAQKIAPVKDGDKETTLFDTLLDNKSIKEKPAAKETPVPPTPAP